MWLQVCFEATQCGGIKNRNCVGSPGFHLTAECVLTLLGSNSDFLLAFKNKKITRPWFGSPTFPHLLKGERGPYLQITFQGLCSSEQIVIANIMRHLLCHFLWRWRWIMLPARSLPPKGSFWFEDGHLSTLPLPCGEGANRSFVSSVEIRWLSATLRPHVNPIIFQRPYLAKYVYTES